MPFGLCHPAVFQALINDILKDMISHFMFVYSDEILMSSETMEEHGEQVRLVLQRLLGNNLQVKPEKCEFHSTKVNFLCFVIAQGKPKPV